MPQHLREHAPRGHTEERLSYKAAEMYHKTKNIGKMLASLNRLSSIQDRVNFLRKHHNHNNEYMSHAAKILRDNGKNIHHWYSLSVLLSLPSSCHHWAFIVGH